MEHENKTRIPAWLRPSTIRRMDGWLEEANCKSHSEFIEKSLHFYMGYLSAEDASEYLPNALTATLRGIVTDSAKSHQQPPVQVRGRAGNHGTHHRRTLRRRYGELPCRLSRR